MLFYSATEEQGYFCKDNSPFTITIGDNALTKFCPKTNNKAECIGHEAILMCTLKEYASLVGVMALSSILGRIIFSYYPEVGLSDIETYLNCELSPGDSSSSSDPVHLLWSRDGDFDNRPNVAYQPNHFVPLFAIPVEETIPETIQTKIVQPRKQVELTDFLQRGQEKQATLFMNQHQMAQKMKNLIFQKNVKLKKTTKMKKQGHRKHEKIRRAQLTPTWFPQEVDQPVSSLK